MPSTKSEIKADLVFDLRRDDEKETRTLSIATDYEDIRNETQMARLEADLQAFAQIFIGGDSATQLGGISANQFIQPAAWRDNDEEDPPWTTKSITPKIVETYTYTLDPIGGDDDDENPRNLRVEGNLNSSSDTVSLYFDGLTKPTVSAKINGQWEIVNTTIVANQYYRFDKVEGMTEASVYLPAYETYEAFSITIPIVY